VVKPRSRKGVTPANAGKTYDKRFLEPWELAALMNQCPTRSNGVRDRALIAFLYRTGVDLSEALDRKLTDLHLEPDEESVSVYGRRNRTARTLALDEFVLRELRPWLDMRARFPGEHLFCTVVGDRLGARLGDNSVRSGLHRLAEAAGISERVTPSAFRNTLAAELFTEAWPFHYLQAQLGITMLTAFQYYIEDLGIRPPADDEIMELMRTRPPAPGPGPP